ncbi:MAG: LamG-like jellyroll fold domain-containing protein [Spirochaetota bacterium]
MKLSLSLLMLMLSASCKNSITTDEYLKAQGLDSRLSLSETSVIMQVNATRTFTIIGGKPPFSVKVLGSGTPSISGNTLTYTAGSLIDNVSLNVTDAQNFVATIAIDVQGVATQPSDISGAALWLKADALSLADNATVTSWPDSSGNGLDFSGGGGAVFRTNFVNGKPVISFNGSSHYLARSANSAINTASFTLFVLYYPENVAVTFKPPFMSKSDASGQQGYYIYVQNSRTQAYYGPGSGWITLTSSDLVTANNWYLAEIRIDNTAFSFHQNAVLHGQLATALSPFSPNTIKPVWIGAGDTNGPGASNFFTGKIAEIIYFNRALTAGEVQGVRCYLKSKYALGFGC